MFKLYKNFRARDWLLLIVILGLTVLQVWATMTIIDYVKNIITAITYVNYHNNPALLGDMVAQGVSNYGWDAFLAIDEVKLALGDKLDTMIQISNASSNDIWKNAGIMVALSGLMVLVQLIIAIIASYISASLSTIVRTKIYNKVENFSIAEMNRFSTPSLITRTTNDIQNVQITNVMMMRTIFAAPVTAIWAILKINAASKELTLATIIAVVVLLVFIIVMMVVVLPRYRKVQTLIDKINGVSRENLTGIRVIRAFNAQEYQANKFEKANDELTRTQMFTGRVLALFSPVTMIIMNGIGLAIYFIGANLINAGEIQYATVTAFSTLSSQIIMAFMILMMMFILWPRASVCAQRINEVLETKPSIVDPVNPKEPAEAGTIEFKNVSFKYPDGENDAISNINFKVNKGEVVAFIGATGSGKTTLINLISRLYDATEGQVLVDGVDVKDLTQHKLRSLIGYVPQKGFLFKGSVKDNVALSDKNMSLDNVIDACEVACAREFVEAKDEKYDFMISQGGKNVSGGQRQRLCIARAVAMHPEIYIFDDSFSALDYKTDKKVRENIKNMNDGATRIIVAQRIGTIMDADKIIVIEDGKIVGMGKHQDLLKNCDIYLDIALSQLSKEELGLCHQ